MNLAEELIVRPTQLILAWLLHQGQDIFPNPGNRKAQRIDENGQKLCVTLDAASFLHQAYQYK